MSSNAIAQRLPPTAVPNLTVIYERTEHDTARGSHQCGGIGRWHVPVETWSPDFYVNTDTDWGGCVLKLGVQDPTEAFGPASNPKYKLMVSVSGPAGQCGTSYPLQAVPFGYTYDSNWFGGQAITIDTDDNRRGPCRITFMISGGRPSDSYPQLQIKFKRQYPEDVSQCLPKAFTEPNTYVSAGPQSPVAIEINTDDAHPGGCYLSFRLCQRCDIEPTQKLANKSARKRKGA